MRLGDARQSIRTLESDAYDIAIGDAFGGLAMPWHLTTTEFLAEVSRVLRPGGMYVANIIDYPPLRFSRAEAATATSVFAHVALIAGRPTLAGESGGNLILVASDAPPDGLAIEAALAAWQDSEPTGVITDSDEVTSFIGDSVVLTDDFAPVDQLLGR